MCSVESSEIDLSDFQDQCDGCENRVPDPTAEPGTSAELPPSENGGNC